MAVFARVWLVVSVDGLQLGQPHDNVCSNHAFHVYDAPAEMPGETQI
jgi:hypothetical protein